VCNASNYKIPRFLGCSLILVDEPQRLFYEESITAKNIEEYRDTFLDLETLSAMIKIVMSLISLTGLYWAIIDNVTLASLINLKSFAAVFVPACLFAITGNIDVKTRINNFAAGSVLAGWIGSLIGVIAILTTFDLSDPNTLQESIPPAVGIALLTVLYGYIAKAICFLVTENIREEYGK